MRKLQFTVRITFFFLPQLNKSELLLFKKKKKYEGFYFQNVPYCDYKWLGANVFITR
jgi:hypothetical protein